MPAGKARQSDEDCTPTWLAVERPPALDPGDLHLWLIRADGDGRESDSLLHILGERQRQRAERMTRVGIRSRYVKAQAGLRRILGAYLDCHPAAIAFSHGPAGKPGLAPHRTDLELNLTTTGDIALVAVRRGQAVGIDCERIRPRENLVGIAERMFDPAEVRALAATPEPLRNERFYRAWTALEADCKCDGRGLFRPRAAAAMPPRIAHFRPASGYVAAVASASLPAPGYWSTLELIVR